MDMLGVFYALKNPKSNIAEDPVAHEILIFEICYPDIKCICSPCFHQRHDSLLLGVDITEPAGTFNLHFQVVLNDVTGPDLTELGSAQKL